MVGWMPSRVGQGPVGESGVNANIHPSTSFGQDMNYWTMQCLPGVCRAQESEGKFGWFVHLNVDSTLNNTHNLDGLWIPKSSNI
jgi:hypothetical protein